MKRRMTLTLFLSSLLFSFHFTAHAEPDMLCTDDLRACISAEPEPIEEQVDIEESHEVAGNESYQLAGMPAKISSQGNKTFVFDPRRLKWGAYNANGQLIRSGRASGGKGYCSDVKRRCRTPIGHFRVYSKGPSHCRSSKYPLGRGGAPMPHCMFFHRGYAIHGSPNVPGYNASHGCIRVLPSAARWLHQNFISHGTRVIVRPY